MDEVITIYRNQYYASLVPELLALCCLYIGIKRRKYHPELFLFPVYFLCYLSINQVFTLSSIFHISAYTRDTIFENWDNLFTLIEFVIYTTYIHRILTVKQKKIATLLSISFVLFFIFSTIQGNLDHHLRQSQKSVIYTTQSVILILFCLFYYINLFRKTAIKQLSNEASFWIITGLFSMLTAMLPFSIAEGYLIHNFRGIETKLYAIDNILYGINFVIIIKAYLCKPVIPVVNTNVVE